MAGIGFKVSRMLQRKSLTMDFLAFFYSALVSVGPWIISSASIWFIMRYMEFRDEYFRSAMIYSFIFSVMITGGINLPFTRRVSDIIYSKHLKKLFPEFLSAGLVLFVVLLLSSSLFFTFNSHPFWFSFLSTWFFITIGLTWFSSIMMAETKKLGLYTFGYLVLGIGGTFLAFIFGSNFGSSGGMVGFIISDMVCLMLFTFFIGKTFGFRMGLSFEWMKESKKYWELYLIGWIYYIAIWVDDFVFWFSKYSYELPRGFRYSPHYDLPMFLAYLSIIPTMIMFVMVIETKFYRKYKEFYDTLIEGAQLSTIKSKHTSMLNSLNYSIGMTMKIQFVFTALLILFNEMRVFRDLSDLSRMVLRMGLIGAMANGFFMMILLILLYFEFRKEALFSTIFVFTLNLILTKFFLNIYGFKSAGMGYTLAFFFGSILSYEILRRKLKELIRIEYLRQPLGIPSGYVKVEKLR